MPKAIATKHMKRMFPYAFFNELSENLKGYTLNNPAFLIPHKDDELKKGIYEKSRPDDLLETLNKQNIIEVEPFGELLQLDLCVKTEDVPKMLQPKERAGVPLSMLVCQLYDSTEQPVFSRDVTNETIKQIPEVLWDDPNLLLAVIDYTDDGAQVGVLKMPKFIEQKVFEERENTDTPGD